MSYLVFARKYRPQSFADVIGQEHITHILEKAVSEKKPRHAYLFCGSRGTGKTTCARILAKELNASSSADGSSLDLGLQSSMDIIEIDGASNNGVDDVRVLRENVQLVPMSGGYKVYIIDEVHMLSPSAFNALLKTLEEPPEHVVFIFATTEPGKLPSTVLSRCQRFDFKRIPVEKITVYLREICQKEGVDAEDEALLSIARAAQGGMRDALSVLDQVSAITGKITLTQINELFGLVEAEQLAAFVKAIAAKDLRTCIQLLDRVVESGKDIKHLSSDLVQYFRHIMLFKVGGKDLEGLVDLPKAQKEEINAFASAQTIAWIIRALEIIINAQDVARITEDPRLALELALAKIVADIPIESAVEPGVSEKKSYGSALKPVVARAASVSVAPAVSIAQADRQSAVAKPAPTSSKSSAGNFLNNNKGVLSMAPLETVEDAPGTGSTIALQEVRAKWNELTFAVSQQKISLGTYLQAGNPIQVSGSKITIAFRTEDSFNKECVETIDNLALAGDIFSRVLGVKVQVVVVVTDAVLDQDTPVADEAVEMFDGEVVNEWINDE